jgi:uncharacterized repeat protein (TIGR03803 family)
MTNRMTLLCVAALLSLSAISPIQAQSVTFDLLYSFSETNSVDATNTDGANPQAALVLSGKTLYGTAYDGGDFANGTVFRVNIDGSDFTNLYSFTPLDASSGTNTDGANPIASLVLSGNTLYGTTQYGGFEGNGTVFKINTDGSNFMNLYNFSPLDPSSQTNTDGASPAAGLVIAGNTLYGAAEEGGFGGSGTVFSIETNGSNFANLHNFAATATYSPYPNVDGAYPAASLLLSGNALYGTAQNGGAAGNGTVFSVNTNGSNFMNLYSFSATSSASPYTNTDGAIPLSSLVLSGGALYGTSYDGGATGNGTVFRFDPATSSFTNFHSFTTLDPTSGTNTDGANPVAGLISSGTMLYGTSGFGGFGGSGTVFGLNTDGSDFTNIYNFTGTSSSYPNTNGDGAYCFASLILADFTLYATAAGGGNTGDGTVFALDLPQPPTLGISMASQQLVISWPAAGSNYQLQTVPDLASGTWSNVTTGIALSGSNYIFTNTPSGQAAFFRLLQQ